MKQKILTLVIGILIGAILATVGFIIYTKVIKKPNNNMPQMMDRNFEMPDDMLNEIQNNGGRKNMKGGTQEGNPNKQKNNGTADDKTTSNIQVDNGSNQPPELPNGEQPSGEMPQGNPPTMPNSNKSNSNA